MSQTVRRSFPKGVRVTRPAGGFLLWVQLPESVDSLELYKRALRAGIATTPGYLFSAKDRYRNFMRLNAANWSEDAERAVHRLGAMVGELAQQGRAREA
jgi:DNA-binding transcriptional MocR family regulator